MLPKLNFPEYNIRIDLQSEKARIWDNSRKKWLALTPEEWVRQHWMHYLSIEKLYPASLLTAEKSFKLNGLTKRFDILAGHPPQILVECKAPGITIDQRTLDQALRYNLHLKVPFLIVSNGLQHYVFEVDFENPGVKAISELPAYQK